MPTFGQQTYTYQTTAASKKTANGTSSATDNGTATAGTTKK